MMQTKGQSEKYNNQVRMYIDQEKFTYRAVLMIFFFWQVNENTCLKQS